MQLTALQQKLRSFFLEELLIDDGWDAYVSLLLSNISGDALSLCGTNGFPYQLDISEYAWAFDVETSTDSTTISYPQQNKALLDFGPVDILMPAGTESVVVNGKNVPIDIGYFSVSGNDSFSVTVAGGLPTFELAALPESLMPTLITQKLLATYNMFDANAPAVSPQALYGAIFDTGVNNFYIVLQSELTTSLRSKIFNDYITFYNIQKASTADGQPYLSAAFASDAPINALRDRFGIGGQNSLIYGYDKRYIVCADNIGGDNLVALTADTVVGSGNVVTVTPGVVQFPQGNASAAVSVTTTPNGGFTTDRSECATPAYATNMLAAQSGDADNSAAPFYILLTAQSSYGVTAEGIVKNYNSLSLSQGQLRSVDIYIAGTEASFIAGIGGDTAYAAWRAAIEQILGTSIPAAAGYTINFVEATADSTLWASDVLNTAVPQILINGKDSRGVIPVALGQRAGDASITITTRPGIIEYEPQIK